MSHDNYPKSSASNRESELASSRQRLQETHRLVNLLKTRWYDYVTARRENDEKSETLRDEIVALTNDLQEELSFITTHIAHTLTSTGDLLLVELLKQEAGDSLDHLKML